MNINIISFPRQKLFFLCCVILLISIILEIWTVNRLSTFGERINNLEKAKQNLSLENQILENYVAKASSLSEIEKYSKSMGFEKISNIYYFQTSGLALNR